MASPEMRILMRRYLSYSNTESGKASEYTKEDLIRRVSRNKAKA